MRRKKADWEKFVERLEAGRIELRKQLGLPPYREPASRDAFHVTTPKFGANGKKQTGPKPRKAGHR